ncbi:MAG: DUF2975 domain-containing protein [Candidatus Izemoplasmatales bacterium]
MTAFASILMVVLIALAIALIAGIIYMLTRLNRVDFDASVRLLKRAYLVAVVLIVGSSVIGIIAALPAITMSELFLIAVVKTVIYVVLLLRVHFDVKALIDNLERKAVFVAENVERIDRMGRSFVYLVLVEVAAGLVIQGFGFLTGTLTEFNLYLNAPILLYLGFGLMLIVVAKVLKLAIEIHEENRLTI